ncbi:MAG: CpXC domain-containing protein [Anaerolineales bacterium]
MPRTQINCPNCKQPIMADVQQLFDVAQDPDSKSRLLSGMSNFIQCQVCGYQGTLATPIVYHDPDKELLLTYVPGEIGLPRDEQERLIGNLINQVVNHLPAEKRKAYLFTPQAQLTMQSLIERILEADGITKEMIKAQQDKLNFLQQLSTTGDEQARIKLIKEKESLVDADLFTILNRLLETAAGSGDQAAAEQLAEIQGLLIENSEVGKEIKQQSDEVRAAIESLQEAGQNLTREKLLELVIEAPNDIRLSALVSLTRPAIDYTFYQLLTEKIDAADGDEKERLSSLREKLLELTSQLDKQVEVRAQQSRQLLEQVMQSDDVMKAIQANAAQIDEFFVQAVQEELEKARKSGDLEKSAKLNQIDETLREAMNQPPEIEFIQELLEAPDEVARQELLESNPDKVTPELFQMLSGLMNQVAESGKDKELLENIKIINRQVLRYSMKSNIKGG